MSKTHSKEVPKEVSHVTEALRKAGFEAYLVGGCVRDLLLKKKPKDWDVTTNAKPEEIVSLFEKTFYENEFGTVGVVNENTSDKTLKIIEVTPYRIEGEYSDSRRPDSVEFSDKLEDDLKRRDFTINAVALDDSKGQIVDLYKGQEDLKAKVIRTVGDPEERFGEDGLRLLRAVRLHAELGFTINIDTQKAIKNKANLLSKIAKERIRDEFIRIIMSDRPMEGLVSCETLGLLKYIVPELKETIGVDQGGVHNYDVWEHLLRSLQHSADKNWPLHIRLSALFHDIAKPQTRRSSGKKKQWSFYGHEVVGAKMTKKIMENLKFPKDLTEKVTKLVRWHMFFSDPETITLSAVRRMIANVGKENIWDLIDLRICDRVGTGRPKEAPYRLRKYKSMIEEAMRDPVTVGMLKVDGRRIMEVTHETPGPKIGFILHALLEEVLEDPKLNNSQYLEEKAEKLADLSVSELKRLGEKGKEKMEMVEEREKTEIRKKHWVD